MIFTTTRVAKMTLTAAFAAFSLVVPASAAQLGIAFIETINGDGAGNDTLSSSNSAAIITGSTDNWNIDLSALGITLSSADLPQQWAEAPGEAGVNVLQMVDATTLNLLSEDTAPPSTPDGFCGTGSPLPEGTTCFIGDDTLGNQWFATVEETTAATPEPASLLLSGLGLAGLAIAGIRRKRQA